MARGRGFLLSFILAAACFSGCSAQRTVCTQEAVADIVFMVDGSWSIGTENFEQIRRFLHTLVSSFDVGPDHIRIGLVQYSTTPRTEFRLNTYQNKGDILQYISTLPYLGGGTHTGQGLDFLLQWHFVEAAGSRARQNVPQIAVVITDGKSQDDVDSHALRLRRKGIILYAIGIKDADVEQLKEIANEPHSQHVYSVSDFAALQGISQNIIQTLCTTVEEAKRQVQQLRKECATATKADVVFLVDGSSSIGNENFNEVRQFLRSIVSGLDIGPDKVRVGLAQYSNEPHQEFLLKDHMDKTSLLAQMDRFPYREGGTETGKAINFTRTEFFTKEAGSRAADRVPQILMVLTDGDSADDVKVPAQMLRNQGIIVFAIGVGTANLNELESIANRPLDRFRLTIDNFQALGGLTDNLLPRVCISIEDQGQALAEKFADIFFLVDSGVTQQDFQLVRTYLTRLVNQMKVGANAHHIGLAQYGIDVKTEFNLTTYKTKEDILSAIRRFRPRRPQPTDPRNLGHALDHASKYFFTSEAGGRADQGYRQYLIIFSGKESDDNFKREARLIKSKGVTVIGMSLGSSLKGMKVVASQGQWYQSTDNAVQILKPIFEKQEVKEEASSECKGANVADIVFIVDESGSIGTPNFQLVRTFLYSLVNKLEVGKNRVRVGIMTYNDNPRAQVDLDTFDDKRELLNFINILPYHGGGTKTGLALDYARKNVFVSQKGSRKNVQQVAVVITDGKSQDNVSIAAAHLRRTGVTVYAVGVKDADKAELRQMASHPTNKHIFTVDSFSMLKTLEMSLQKMLCQNIIEQAVSVSSWDSGIKQGCVQTDEADIFFLIDHSGSIYPADFYDMKKFIIEFLNTFRIGPHHVRVGVAKYADNPTMEFDLTVHTDAKSLEKAVENIKQIGGGTETGKALDFMTQYFDRAATSRGGKVREYLVVITDGKSSDEVKAPAERLKNQGVNVYAIGVKSADVAELNEISGSKKRTFFVDNFDALIPIKNEIISDICSEDLCKDQRGDLLFLIDSSGSIEPQDYLKMKNFVKEVIDKSAVGQNEVHIGVMQYSTRQQLEFRLNSYYTKDEMINAINNMQQIGGGTHTGEAIDQVSQYFDRERGGRPHEKRRLVVITDGESQDEVKSPAQRLRAKGVLVYAIGVEDANSAELLDISGSPDRMFVGKDFDALKELENRVSLEICDPKRDCKKTEKADIIFLVDGSTSIDKIPGAWESMIKFMETMINQTTVGKDLTRFGFIVYNDNPNIIFTLNKYSSKTEVLEAIRTYQKGDGNTETAEALKYSLPFFNEINGGRAALSVPQILMLITDGQATRPADLPKAAAALRDNGINVFSIGIKEADVAELEVIASGDKSKVFFVDNFDALKDLHRNISAVLCKQTKPVCEKQKADLVFLLDQSGSIGTVNPNDYMTMKNFTINLVNSFTVAKDFVRVGLAQFSDVFQHEFFLNEFNTSQSINSHIRGFIQSGGGTKIGLALESIRKYFAAEHGGRKAEGISQNLVLITDGDSQDDVEEAAYILRGMGVEVFAIGIGDVHDLELLQITGTPKRLFTVENFASLEKIRQKVIDTICQSKPDQINPGCSIDIAIGFDISQRSGAIGETLVSGHPKLRDLLPDIVNDISTVNDLCCLPDKVFKPQISYRVVNREGDTMYDFNFEEHSKEVLAKVMTTTIREPTFFNTAMLRSFEEKFRAQSGAGVKVLVIFSDGLDEHVMKLEEESDRLRKSGVSALLTVALEGTRDPGQLQMVEFGRGFGYKLPLSIGMPSIGGNILKQIDTVSDRECCNVTCKCSGHEGVRGSRGPGGLKGVTGQKGYPGFPGDEGVAGDRGLPGPSGPQGVQGCPGLRGVKGSRGLRGNRGEEGEDGLDGVDGEQGDTGHDGSRGERGHSGNPGPPGIRGEVGPKGQRGLRGDPGEPGAQNQAVGPKGQVGNPGLPGLPGVDGRPGVDGEIGNPGLDGRRGSLGLKGQPGPAGSQGLPGIPGASGPQGSRGVRGAPGPSGMPGLPGSQGTPGQAGPPGTNGRRGSIGQKGQPGDPGDRGAQGPQGPIGMPGQDGRDGYGPQGPKGAKGDPGFPGYPGLLGEDGLQGPKGDPGPKGNQGRGGVAGQPGESGQPGQPGHPGHMGRRGPPGGRAMTNCQLITYIRENCACSIGQSECPAQPTELVFGLDMSQDVTPAAFERQRSALLHLLDQVEVAESNCPRGARVAVVAYSAHTKYLIRFQDYRRKTQLLDSVKNIALERTSNRRQLGGAMRFVGNHVFKRVRSGMLVRKVAVFLVGGPTQDVDEVLTATMEYRGLDIIPAIISLRNTAAIGRALEADDSGNSIYVVLGRDMEADLRKIMSCTICYDPCRPSDLCSFIKLSDAPQEADMDLVMMMDDSREVKADEYAGAQQLLGSVVQQLAVSKQPRRAGNQARVAFVQQGTVHTAKPEFGLQSFQSHEPMRKYLLEGMHQHGGSALLGQTLEFSLDQVLLKAGSARKKKVLLALVGSRTSAQDRSKLLHVSQRAKCAGVTVFVATVGDRYEQAEVEQLASAPLQQHLVHLGRLDPDQQGYGRRFFRCFVSALNKEMNTYPHPSLKRTCAQLATNPDAGQQRFPDGQGGAELEEFFLEDPQGRYQEQTAQQVDFRENLRPGGQQRVTSRGQDPNVLLKPQRPSVTSKDACFLRQDQGSCQNYTMMWFFDTEQNECSRFWFGGCGGNNNRFATQDECEDLCLSKSH